MRGLIKFLPAAVLAFWLVGVPAFAQQGTTQVAKVEHPQTAYDAYLVKNTAYKDFVNNGGAAKVAAQQAAIKESDEKIAAIFGECASPEKPVTIDECRGMLIAETAQFAALGLGVRTLEDHQKRVALDAVQWAMQKEIGIGDITGILSGAPEYAGAFKIARAGFTLWENIHGTGSQEHAALVKSISQLAYENIAKNGFGSLEDLIAEDTLLSVVAEPTPVVAPVSIIDLIVGDTTPASASQSTVIATTNGLLDTQ